MRKKLKEKATKTWKETKTRTMMKE
jgi:hypothetical protein